MPTTTEPKILQALAVDLVLAMADGIDYATIDPIKKWERTKSALASAAQSSNSFSEMVSTMAKKLQIEILPTWREGPSSRVVALAESVDPIFEEFRTYVDKNATFVFAIAQHQHKTVKNAREVARRADRDDPIDDLITEEKN